MKSPKLFLISLLVAAFPLLSSAQILKKASQRTEIASVESETTGDWVSVQSVLRMEDDGSYWLSLGHAGIGSDILQIEFDPVTEQGATTLNVPGPGMPYGHISGQRKP